MALFLAVGMKASLRSAVAGKYIFSYGLNASLPSILFIPLNSNFS